MPAFVRYYWKHLPPAGSAFGPPTGFFFVGESRSLPNQRPNGLSSFLTVKTFSMPPGRLLATPTPIRSRSYWHRNICASKGWSVAGIHFYTGIPSAADKPFWNHFWMAKMAVMGIRGIRTFSRPLRYRNQTVSLPDGTLAVTLVGQEKGINGTGWIRIDRVSYDACIDPNDYRPKKSSP